MGNAVHMAAAMMSLVVFNLTLSFPTKCHGWELGLNFVTS